MRLVFVLALAAAATASSVEIPEGSAAIRAQLESAEQAIERRLASHEDLAPMRMLWKPRGAYLKGYGAVLSVELNIAPTAALSPFRPAYSKKELREINQRKQERLGVLKRRMQEILVEEGARLTQVPLDQKVALVVTLFHFSWEDLTNLPSQMVLQASRSALQELRGKDPKALAAARTLEPEYY